MEEESKRKEKAEMTWPRKVTAFLGNNQEMLKHKILMTDAPGCCTLPYFIFRTEETV